MEKARKFGVLLLTISIMMIISGTVCTFVVSLKEDQKKTQERMVVVNDTFDTFNESVTAYEVARDTLYTESLGNLYYDTLVRDDAMFKEKLSNYENVVDGVIKYVKEMDNLCDNVYYPNSDVNSKCSNYKLIYEQVANYFMEDVKLYNTTIKTFNEQQVAIGSTVALEEYKTNKKYVDYNKDKVFEGKTVEKKEDKKEEVKDESNTTKEDGTTGGTQAQ